MDLNPFEKEISWKGQVGGNVRPVKATVLQVAALHQPPHLHYSPNQLQAAMVHAPAVGRNGQAGSMPGWAMR